jgi:hypothetical protein
VQDVLCWPEHLTHYRFVRDSGKDPVGRLIVEMSAWSGAIPMNWTATFESDRKALELRFEHLASWTKGMREQWTLTPTRDGTRIEIVHGFRFPHRTIGWLVEWIIGRFFVQPIAQRTLATFKSVLEAAHPA